MVEEEILQRMIEESLDLLYQNDGYLICNHRDRRENHVGERSVAFRFGIYFNMLSKKNFPEFQVDMEYNRNMDNRKTLPSWHEGCFPDLILHKRGSNSDNLLVIEMKTWWNPHPEKDKQKIWEFCDINGKYCYKYGAFILIGKKREDVQIVFFKHDEERHLCRDILKPTMKTPSSNSFKSN